MAPQAAAEKGSHVKQEARRSVWEFYNEKAADVDRDMTKDWNVALDVLLIFAALFSAILASFTVDSYNRLQPDNEDILVQAVFAISAQLAGTRDEPIEMEKFAARPLDIALNFMLFLSLSISVVVAMCAMVVKQWVQEYDSGMQEVRDPAERARMRHQRYESAMKWGLPNLVGALHICMMVALLLFYAGLCILVVDHREILGAVLLVFGTGLLTYIVPTIIAVHDPHAPFRSYISRLILRFTSHTVTKGPEPNEQDLNEPLRWSSVEWLARRTPVSQQNTSAICAIVGALGDFPRSWSTKIKDASLWDTLFKFVVDNDNFKSPAAETERRTAARYVLPIFKSDDYDDPKGGPLIGQLISLVQFSNSVDDQWAGLLRNMQLCGKGDVFLKSIFGHKYAPDEPLLVVHLHDTLEQQRKALTSIIPTLAVEEGKRDKAIIDLAFSQNYLIGHLANLDASSIPNQFSLITQLCTASHHLRSNAIEFLILVAWDNMNKVPPRYQTLAGLLPRKSPNSTLNKFNFFDCLYTVIQGEDFAFAEKALPDDDEKKLRKEFTKLLPVMAQTGWFDPSPSTDPPISVDSSPSTVTFRDAAKLLLYALMPSFSIASISIKASSEMNMPDQQFAQECVKKCYTTREEMSPRKRECLAEAFQLFQDNGIDLRKEIKSLPTRTRTLSSDPGDASQVESMRPWPYDRRRNGT